MRLLLGAATTIFVALAASWFAMTLLFQHHIERRVESELTRHARRLVANLSVDADGNPNTAADLADARFLEPASGLYWQLSTPGGALRSRSLWDEQLPSSAVAEGSDWSTRVSRGPFDQRIFLLERVVRPERSGAAVLVQLAYDESAIELARQEFGRELALFLVLLWIILSAAAWVQVHMGLRPLADVGKELDQLRHNPVARLRAVHPLEIRPLTAAINALADAREEDLKAARRRAADLAHGLKTPLSALSAQSRLARDAGAVEAADGLDRAIAAATVAVDAELARARAATIRQSKRRAESAPMPVIERIVGVVERTDFGTNRVFEVDIPSTLSVPMAEDDLTELMGALIENAARFAHRRVQISGIALPAPMLTVEDDGPGLGPGRTDDAIVRGRRLDESGPGHGFGLSIAHELAAATGGNLRMDTAALGGLRVSVVWPQSGA
jgi:signal transduction histidine kinase